MVTGVTDTSNPVVQTAAEQARTKLSGNFDTFLTLLTTQLQNQDPLEPMDSSKFTEQLVQYSQVEQQIETNSKLTDLADTLTKQIQATSAGAALAYIGKTAMFESDGMQLKNNEAKWTYAIGAQAASTKLTITDSKGKTVFETTGSQEAGIHDFTWDGKNAAGDPQAEGIYHLKVTALDSAGKAIDAATSVTEVINGVDMSGADAAVTTPSGTRGFGTIIKILG